MNEAVESLTSNPKRLALVVAGGVALGLGWRYWNKRKNPAAYSSSGGTDPGVDINTGLPTVGAGAGGSSDADRRDTVSDSTLLLPVVNKVVKIGDKLFMTDGTTLTEINPVGGTGTGNGTGNQQDTDITPGAVYNDPNVTVVTKPSHGPSYEPAPNPMATPLTVTESIPLGNGLYQRYTSHGIEITDHP